MNKLGSYTFESGSAATVDERIEQYNNFFETVLSAEFPLKKDDTENIYWVDENKTIGFRAWVQSDSRTPISGVYKSDGQASTQVDGDVIIEYNPATTVYYGVSKDKNVLFILQLRPDGNSSHYNSFVFAKNKNGDWTCFLNDKIFDKNGAHDYSAYCNIFNSADFVAAKAASANGAEFYELYKMLYATSFPDIANTRIKAGNTVYAVVPTYFSNNVWYPSFCFPLFDEN